MDGIWPIEWGNPCFRHSNIVKILLVCHSISIIIRVDQIHSSAFPAILGPPGLVSLPTFAIVAFISPAPLAVAVIIDMRVVTSVRLPTFVCFPTAYDSQCPFEPHT